MLNALPWLILLTSLMAASQEAAPAGWMTFTSKAGRFSISLPGTPAERSQFVGLLKVTKFIAENKKDLACVVSYCDFPEADVKSSTVQKRLDQARDGAVASVAGLAKDEKATLLGGHPGRDFAIEKAGVVIVRMRIYVVDRRVYQILALGPAPVLASKEISLFLDSFRLIK